MTVAVAFKPRNFRDDRCRRVATVESVRFHDIQASLRDAVHAAPAPWDESHGYRQFSLRETISKN
jgi:hypothetical protein